MFKETKTETFEELQIGWNSRNTIHLQRDKLKKTHTHSHMVEKHHKIKEKKKEL